DWQVENILVGVFDNEEKARAASQILSRMEEEDLIAIHASALVEKGDGVRIVNARSRPEGTMGATAVGALIGLLIGPAGLAVGALGGLIVGATADLMHDRLDKDFVRDVARTLEPGKVAVVAEIYEESIGPVNARLRPLGGFVFRRDLSEVANAATARRRSGFRKTVGRAKQRLARGVHALGPRTERKGGSS